MIWVNVVVWAWNWFRWRYRAFYWRDSYTWWWKLSIGAQDIALEIHKKFSPLAQATGAVQLDPWGWSPVQFLNMDQSYTRVCSDQTIRQFSLLVLAIGAIQLVPNGWGPVRFLNKSLAPGAGTMCMSGANMKDWTRYGEPILQFDNDVLYEDFKLL